MAPFKVQFRLKYILVLLVGFVVYLHLTTDREFINDRNKEEKFGLVYAAVSAPISIQTPTIETKTAAPSIPSQATRPRETSTLPVNEEEIYPPADKRIPVPSTQLPALHIICSSDCSTYQRWQVLTQVHSAWAVGQGGRYTWLISGCGDQQEEATINAVNSHFPDPGRDLSYPKVKRC
jgi:hypothetical protein